VRILLIEDVPDEVDRIAAMLARVYPDAEVVALASAQEVEKWLADFLISEMSDAPDAIILDIMLPYSKDRESTAVPGPDFDHHRAGTVILRRLRDVPSLKRAFVAFHTVVSKEEQSYLDADILKHDPYVAHVQKEIGLDGLRRALKRGLG